MFPPTALVAAGFVGNLLASFLNNEAYQKSITIDMKNWIGVGLEGLERQ
jgi:hypothetical protein